MTEHRDLVEQRREELGEEAIENYSQIKTVYVEMGNVKDSPSFF